MLKLRRDLCQQSRLSVRWRGRSVWLRSMWIACKYSVFLAIVSEAITPDSLTSCICMLCFHAVWELWWCPNKRKCNGLNATCKIASVSPWAACDLLVPDCGLESGSGNKSERFCGTDCKLYRIGSIWYNGTKWTRSERTNVLSDEDLHFAALRCERRLRQTSW